MEPKHVLAVHLLNDLSGSPRVLSQVITALVDNGYKVSLLTSRAEDGKSFFNELPIEKRFINYQWDKNKWKTLIKFFRAQWQLFKYVINDKQSDIVHINTILPFGAALAAKIRGKKVVYHLHEVQINNPVLDTLLKRVMVNTANQIISVSKYLTTKVNITKVPLTTIANSVNEKFFDDYPECEQQFDGLMLCNLKTYKGINEFVELAAELPDRRFAMVLNASDLEVEDWKQTKTIPQNLTLSSATTQVLDWYLKSKVVLNLSRSKEWIETFGMTALEAMALGKPVIVPVTGGIADLVEEGIQGYHVESSDLNGLKNRFLSLIQTDEQYQRYSASAKAHALEYHPSVFSKTIPEFFHKL